MKRCIVVGCGGRGSYWTNTILAQMRDRVEVVGLVDINDEPLQKGAETHGLPDSALFKDTVAAMDAIEADFCLISTPPWVHEENVRAACEHGLAILSEKPISDTLQSTARIKRMVDAAGLPMVVVQNYRYSPFMLAFRDVLRQERLGRLNYVIGRYAQDYNPPKSWGARFRHEMASALVVEGSVHHFDMLRNLTGGDCEVFFGFGWIPPWADFKGECQGLYVMQMSNATYSFYEGSLTCEGIQNGWHKEYYRAECEEGAVIVDNDNVVRIIRVDGEDEIVEQATDLPGEGEAIVLEFLDYLQTGEPTQTCLADNIKSVGMVFAAIRCHETGMPVNVPQMLAEAEASAGV
ncbi:MAG TPA: Gfo/Idh/MocA family oxidoreductase [Armatimonadota bacterium]|nr:Gfo/Idh/MocA family oxidoreductase [Armatimonadota bacterium]